MYNYGFVRNTDTWGVNSIPYQQYLDAGLTGLAFNADDPNLDAAIRGSRAAGMHAGIWIPAGNEGDPRAYAQRIKSLYDKYGSDIIPNIEFTGKGYKGSAGWNWNEAMMSELQRLGVPRNMAVAMLPNQDDFNYAAYTSRGVNIMPEAFGANSGTDLFDPESIRQRLIKNGVPESMINVLMAPSQLKGRAGSVFTVDDLSPELLKAMGLNHPGYQTNDGGPTNTRQTASAHASADIAAKYGKPVAPGGQMRDANNPAARAYAARQLLRLRKLGYTPRRFGVGGDVTAQYRALSGILGARRVGAGYQTRPGTNPGVANAIRQQLARRVTKRIVTRNSRGGTVGRG